MRTDFLIDEATGDLKIVDGDFVIGESDTEHVIDIFRSFKGEFKQHPLLGFEATKKLKTVDDLSQSKFKRDLKLQLEFDNYENPTIDLTEGIEKLKINV